MSSHVFDIEKWQALSLFDQLGNIGSEVGRAMNALRRDDKVSLEGAYHRGLDLIDATTPVLSAPRRRELLRAREQFAEAVESAQPDAWLENYFMQYAIAARMTR